ncbi:MAG: YncE family protein [Sedimentibacter sp.]
MKYDDKVSVTGTYQGRLMLFIMELREEDYICEKAVNLGKEDKLAVHSIINSGNSVYLSDSYNNKIYKYDYTLNELYEETVGRDPRHMCIVSDNMYVANFESDNISIIDMTNFGLTGSIPAGIKPHDILYSENNDKLYTCCYEENEIIEYSAAQEIKRRFTTDGKPMHMFVHDGCIILMSYFANGNVHTKINFINIQDGKIEKVIVIDGLASDFDIDYKRNLLYVINIEDKRLYIIDLTKKETVKTIFLGGYPESLTVGEKYVYITNSKKNQIISVDSDSLTIDRLIDLNFTPSCIKIIIEDQK